MDVRLAIVGAQVIDGVGPTPIPSGAVLIGSDGRIAAVGPSHNLPLPDRVPTYQAAGKTLLPGLIDGHVHLTWDKTLYSACSSQDYATRLRLRDPERQLVRAGHYAQMALAAGVTTLRDCGADDFSVLALRDMIAAGQFVGPRILASGRPITTTGGHIYSDWGVDTADEVRAAVGLLASRGVDFVKLIVSGGTTTPGTDITGSQYTLEEVRVAVDEAHRLGLTIAAHAIATDSIRLAAVAGVDTIEHCSWIGSDPRTTVTDTDAVEAMVRHGVRVDHAIIPRPYLFPQEMARAIEIMVRWANFTPMEAIALATREAARALGLDGEIGTIEKGKRAELIVLANNPLKDIRSLRQVEAVFRDGRLVARRGDIVLPGAQPVGEHRSGQ